MNKIGIILIFWNVYVFSESAFKSDVIADIKEINSIQEVTTIFDNASQKDLFIFDIDGVILESTDPIFQSRFTQNQELQNIKNDFMTFLSTKDAENLFFSNLWLKDKIQPIEKPLIDKILSLQKHNIKVIALTAFGTGKLGLIEHLEEWRYKQLVNLGLDFDSSFKLHDITFDELQKTELVATYKDKQRKTPRSAMFYKGILCTGFFFPKGIVLKAFLEKINAKPTNIYFFDDDIKNTNSVIQEMKTMGIKCHAFVYKAATVNCSLDGLDIKIARFQHELMKQTDNGNYISYFEAKKILESQSPTQRMFIEKEENSLLSLKLA